MITKEKWAKIEAVMESGDPVKDVVDEDELLSHAFTLRHALEKLCKAHEEVCPSGAKCETLRFCQRVLEKGEA